MPVRGAESNNGRKVFHQVGGSIIHTTNDTFSSSKCYRLNHFHPLPLRMGLIKQNTHNRSSIMAHTHLSRRGTSAEAISITFHTR